MRTSFLLQLLWVGAGGFVGSALRFGLSGLVHRTWPVALLPIGTLAVNVLGCLAIGFLAAFGESRQLFGPTARLFVLIGVLGGFTTFSTFAYETFALAQDGEFLEGLINVGLQVVVGLVAVWIGYVLGRLL